MDPCVAEDFGAGSSPDVLAAKGYDLVRITARFGLYGHDLAFEVVKPPEGNPWLFVRDPAGIGRGQRGSITDADYAWFENAWTDFRPGLNDPSVAKRKLDAKNTDFVPCTDGAGLQVDLAKAGKSRQILVDMCLVEKADRFVSDVRARAYSLLPLCAGMRTEPPPLCLRLSGDEVRAVEVARILEGAKREVRCPDDLLSEQVHLQTDDTTFQGRASVAAWFVKNCRAIADEVPNDIAGLPDATVLVTGRVATIVDDQLPSGLHQDHFEAAAFSQTWKRDDVGKLTITNWQIGKFVEVNSLF